MSWTSWPWPSRSNQDPRYRQAIERVGDFILRAQMPEPQPAWAQQYDAAGCTRLGPQVRAPRRHGRRVAGRSSRPCFGSMSTPGRSAIWRRYPRALEYLRRSQLPDGRLARFYELRYQPPPLLHPRLRSDLFDSDTPTHYAFKVTSRLGSWRENTGALRALPAADLGLGPYRRPQTSRRPAEGPGPARDRQPG